MTSKRKLCPGFTSKPDCGGEGWELGEPGMVVHTCNPSFGEVEAGRLAVQGHVQLHSRFWDKLGMCETLSQ